MGFVVIRERLGSMYPGNQGMIGHLAGEHQNLRPRSKVVGYCQYLALLPHVKKRFVINVAGRLEPLAGPPRFFRKT